ncbi:MAG: NRDE family protein [Bacteroidetes bacterium]|nr:NRDE family protein [Bacteroidota bacterium]
MCTVTFIPGRDGVYLTSNRDERPSRAAALPPRQYTGLLYPRDASAGGSWIALKNGGDAAVLLNGAFIKHQRREVYRKSRGLVFLDVVGAKCPIQAFASCELEDIEPFTLVLFVSGLLFECRWDGGKKSMSQLNTQVPHIWSSVTLYNESIRNQRQRWLNEWYSDADVSTESIIRFHRLVRLTREDISTVSITSIRIGKGDEELVYLDLKKDGDLQPDARAAKGRLRRWLIRLMHWEYWPFAVVYTPIFFYWGWLSLKARSFFFFNTANPSIQNGGFLLESKAAIYALMPPGSYPKTLYCPLGKEVGVVGLSYPLIGKPDIGQRGLGVRLIRSESELAEYVRQAKVDILLQEYIDYPNEIGVFYYRLPGESRGHISGIVGKELLSVTGDGSHTIEELLTPHHRATLQLPALRAVYGQFLQNILEEGKAFTLVPYGNHSRGAKFIDWSDRIDGKLEQVIDELCRQVPGFYFGRLDIRFRSWEELRAGKAFSVIELNGAGSEPTHIYDPAHSLFFAWKEIIRHLRLLYRISRANARQQGLRYLSFREGWRLLRDYGRHEKLIS